MVQVRWSPRKLGEKESNLTVELGNKKTAVVKLVHFPNLKPLKHLKTSQNPVTQKKWCYKFHQIPICFHQAAIFSDGCPKHYREKHHGMHLVLLAIVEVPEVAGEFPQSGGEKVRESLQRCPNNPGFYSLEV